MKRKQYRIEDEFPSVGDVYQTRVDSRLRVLRFFRQDGRQVWLSDGSRLFQRRPEQVKPVRIDHRLLLRLGFQPNGSRLVLDRSGLHFEAYERAGTMHIEITPHGSDQKTYVCCDFVHEVQHLKRLRIAGLAEQVIQVFTDGL